MSSKFKPRGKIVNAKVNSKKTENNTPITIDDESIKQFEVELCWCIQQLQRLLNSGKINDKEVQENTKVLNVLMNNSSSYIKKRQLMRLTCGDYRTKMLEEDKKFTKGLNMKISTSSPSKKSKFVKKSSSARSNNLKLNFEVKNCKNSYSEASAMAESLPSNVNNSLDFTNSQNNFRFKFCVDETDNCK